MRVSNFTSNSGLRPLQSEPEAAGEAGSGGLPSRPAPAEVSAERRHQTPRGRTPAQVRLRVSWQGRRKIGACGKMFGAFKEEPSRFTDLCCQTKPLCWYRLLHSHKITLYGNHTYRIYCQSTGNTWKILNLTHKAFLSNSESLCTIS